MSQNSVTQETEKAWYVYILHCADHSFYTGITTDLTRRIAEHNAKNSKSRYTRARQPVSIIFQEQHPDRSSATKREAEIKKQRIFYF